MKYYYSVIDQSKNTKENVQIANFVCGHDFSMHTLKTLKIFLIQVGIATKKKFFDVVEKILIFHFTNLFW